MGSSRQQPEGRPQQPRTLLLLLLRLRLRLAGTVQAHSALPRRPPPGLILRGCPWASLQQRPAERVQHHPRKHLARPALQPRHPRPLLPRLLLLPLRVAQRRPSPRPLPQLLWRRRLRRRLLRRLPRPRWGLRCMPLSGQRLSVLSARCEDQSSPRHLVATPSPLRREEEAPAR